MSTLRVFRPSTSIPLKYCNRARGRKEQVPVMKYVIIRFRKPTIQFTINKATLSPIAEDYKKK